MKTYTMRDDGGSTESIEAETLSDARRQAREWARAGDWGDDGCVVTVRIMDEDGNDVECVEVEIAQVEPDCVDGAEHELRDDPIDDFGCRSLGGTTIVSWQYCLRCGRKRIETDRGTSHHSYEGVRVSVEWQDVDDDDMARIREHYDWRADA
jgi:hypothetical protein